MNGATDGDELRTQLARYNAVFEDLIAHIPKHIYKPYAKPAVDFVNGKPVKRPLSAETQEAKRAAKKARFAPPSSTSAGTNGVASTSSTVTGAKDAAATAPKQQLSREELKAKLAAKIASLSAERAEKRKAAALDADSAETAVAESNRSLKKKNRKVKKASKAVATNETNGDEADSEDGPGKAMGTREALLEESRKAAAEVKAEEKRAKAAKKKQAKLALEAAATVAPVVKKAEVVEEAASASPSKKRRRSGKDKSGAEATAADESSGGNNDVEFSHLDFTNPDSLQAVDTLPSRHNKRSKSGTHTKKQSTAEEALKKLEARSKFLDKLTPQSRERAEEKDKWKSLIGKAGGEKVLDDEGKLRKMIKLQEKKKAKSSKQWKDRTEDAAYKEKAKQSKRTENIAARNQAKKDRKRGIKPSKKPSGTTNKSSPGGAGGKKKLSQKGFERSKFKSTGQGKSRSSTSEKARTGRKKP